MILRTNSVMKTPAMINNHLQKGYWPNATEPGIAFKLSANKGYLGNYFYLFCLLETSGARFTEVLSIHPHEIAINGSCLIRGRKRSHDRVIKDGRVSDFLLKCKALNLEPFHGCNIFTASRMLKSIGLEKFKKGRKRMTVTGIFRDEYAKNIRSIQREPGTLTREIGHKSSKNDEYYGKN